MLLKSFSRSHDRARDTYFALFLCLCVVLQMLGVPATLLSPLASADLISDLFLEGWSLPQIFLDHYANHLSSILSSAPVPRYFLILLNSVFHPPLV